MDTLKELLQTFRSLPTEISAAIIGSLAAGLVGYMFAVVLAWKQAIQSRKQNALRLHEEMCSDAFSVNVLHITWCVRLKWKRKDEEGKKFRDAVVDAMVDEQSDMQDPVIMKERNHVSGRDDLPSRMSEHQSVSKFLAFFGNLMTYIDARLIDKKLVRQLFMPMYNFYGDFIAELSSSFADLREEIKKSPKRKTDVFQPWVKQTERLESKVSRKNWHR